MLKSHFVKRWLVPRNCFVVVRMLLMQSKLHTCRSNIVEWLSCITSLEARERVILLSEKERTRRSIPAKYRVLLILKRATLETRVMAQAFVSLIN